MHWVTELAWLIELTIMYQRWLDARQMAPIAEHEMYFRTSWVRMCMRLGDGAALRIAQHSGSERAKWIEL